MEVQWNRKIGGSEVLEEVRWKDKGWQLESCVVMVVKYR